MPGMDGMALLREVRLRDPDLPVILITGHGDISTAVEAMREGAWDFLEKPFAGERLVEVVRRGVEKRRLSLENRRLKAELEAQQNAPGPRMVGRTEVIQRLISMVQRISQVETDVLLFGETGTGKDLVARSIHERSSRSGRPFVAINCGAVPESTIESELFGHEKGAFTGAVERRIGKFEHATGGSVFLDEIESMPLALQVKLLRVLQERSVERLGANVPVPLDIRVIAATKVDLKAAAEAGNFREDLYYRLNVVTLPIPALRERREDVPLLFQHFAVVAANRSGLECPPLEAADISALLALYRPGPLGMDMHIAFADRKNGLEKVSYDHADLEPILGETYGIIVYQEQVMRIATDLSGFSMAEADALRKAVGKKNRELMEAQKDQLIAGGEANGYDRTFMQSLWGLIEKFAEYGFNKSHTVAYGVVSYQTAWLKTHYPVEYMAALLTSVKNHKDSKPLYLNECRRMGIPVLPPDVNESGSDFTPRGDEVLFGLSAVRGVGEGIVGSIVEARRSAGRFEDFADFCGKVDASVLNKKTLESLILAGGFAGMGHPRKGLLATYETIVDAALTRKKAEAAGQFSLFDGAASEATPDDLGIETAPPIPAEEYDKSELLRFEREMLGLYVSDHPLFGTEKVLDQYTDATCASLRERDDGASVVVAGVLTALTKKFTRKGDTYLVATIEDLTGQVEVVFWPNTYRAAHEVLAEDAVLVVTGRLEVRDEAVKLTANKVSVPDLSEALGSPVVVSFAAEQCTADAVRRLKDVLTNHAGVVPVHLEVAASDGSRRTYRLDDGYRVERRPGLFGELKSAFGPDAVDVEVGERTFGDEDERPWRRRRQDSELVSSR
jgi:CheY-like chemotaxis protein